MSSGSTSKMVFVLHQKPIRIGALFSHIGVYVVQVLDDLSFEW